MSQASRLKEHFEAGKSITRLSALTDLGIFELSARVIDLENTGMTIDRKRITVTNRWGEKASVTKYWAVKS
jgi:hypothetical protein